MKCPITDCKFPCEVSEIELLQAIEIIPISKKAKDSIKSVPTWNQSGEGYGDGEGYG